MNLLGYFKRKSGRSHPRMKAVRRRYVFDPGTQSMRQRLRYLKQQTRPIIDSKDPIIISVGDRVIRACLNEPNPEYSALHLFNAGQIEARETRVPWYICMSHIMDEFDKRSQDIVSGNMYDDVIRKLDAPPTKRDQTRSWVSRLLRALTPRAFRARDEGSAVAGQHQHVGHVDGKRATSAGRRFSSADRKIVK